MMRIGIVTHFDAAHSLPWEPKGETVHGHTYRTEVVIEGEVNEKGIVLDFRDLRVAVKEVTDRLDHRNLNDVLDLPTCENITRFVFDHLRKDLPVVSVRVWEGEGKWSECRAT